MRFNLNVYESSLFSENRSLTKFIVNIWRQCSLYNKQQNYIHGWRKHGGIYMMGAGCVGMASTLIYSKTYNVFYLRRAVFIMILSIVLAVMLNFDPNVVIMGMFFIQVSIIVHLALAICAKVAYKPLLRYEGKLYEKVYSASK